MRFTRTRRRFASGLALGAATARTSIAQAEQPAPETVLAAQQPGTCILFPQVVEGPYYFDPKLVRANITEGKPGLALKLVLKLIDNASCAPIADALVDVWHCDSGGVYSGYPNQGAHRNF